MALKKESHGGNWTTEKLKALKDYLDEYTTVLKKQPFKLWYIDAFAGTGEGHGRDYSRDYSLEEGKYIRGSALIALETKDKPFDCFLFIEKESKRMKKLRSIIEKNPHLGRREISYKEKDANEVVPKFCQEMKKLERAVVFLDPFATEVKYETIKSIAKTEKIDLWVLFPYMAVNRMLPTDERKISSSNKKRLNELFGDSSWRSVYRTRVDLGGEWKEKDYLRIPELFIERLQAAFEKDGTEKVLKTPLILKNSKNAPLFTLCFAAGNANGARIALPIANYILGRKT